MEELCRKFKKLRFFSQFSDDIISQIIEAGTLLQLPVKNTLFKQGDTGQEMYIILRGSVKVVVTNSLFGSVPFTITTLYDGEYFGEQALYESKLDDEEVGHRRATCIVRGLNNAIRRAKRAICSLFPSNKLCIFWVTSRARKVARSLKYCKKYLHLRN